MAAACTASTPAAACTACHAPNTAVRAMLDRTAAEARELPLLKGGLEGYFPACPIEPAGTYSAVAGASEVSASEASEVSACSAYSACLLSSAGSSEHEGASFCTCNTCNARYSALHSHMQAPNPHARCIARQEALADTVGRVADDAPHHLLVIPKNKVLFCFRVRRSCRDMNH